MSEETSSQSNNPRNLLYFGLILVIALIFATQWGPGSRGCELPFRSVESDAAAVVNGKEIPLRVYRETYNRQLEFYRRQGSPINDAMAKQLGLPQRIVDSLVADELVAQAAEKQGISVSDADLAVLIQKNPDFQQNGQFDEQRYRDVLRDFYRMTYAEFETQMRRALTVQKFKDTVGSSTTVSADEVRARYDKEGNKANIAFVRFMDSMFADDVKKPTPAEVAAFSTAHAKDIEDYYTANSFQYHEKEQVKARHILVKVDKDAPAAEKDKAKAKAEALRKEIEGGKDFAAVAKESSDDPGSKTKGGDLGFNDRDSWVPEFSAAAFSLKPGELSQPVQTPFGFHIIQVQEKKAATDKPLKDVKNDIAALLIKKNKAKEIAKQKAEKSLAALGAGKSLKDQFPASKKDDPSALSFETETKPEAKETHEFAASAEGIPQLGPAADLQKDAFALEAPGALRKVYPVGEGFVVAQVVTRQKPSDADFQKQKDQLTQEALQAKQFEVEGAFVKALRKDAKIRLNKDLSSTAPAIPGDDEPS